MAEQNNLTKAGVATFIAGGALIAGAALWLTTKLLGSWITMMLIGGLLTFAGIVIAAIGTARKK